MITIAAADGGVAQTWADDFYACRGWDAAYVEGIDGVFAVLRALLPKQDAGPTGPAWPANAQHVEVEHALSLLGPGGCQVPDGGTIMRSTWSLDLDSGVIDFAVCYPQEDLYVVDSGVLQPAQLEAFNTAASAIVFKPPLMPPCSADTDVDRFTVSSPTGVITLQDSLDRCVFPPGVFNVDHGRAARMVLEGATHP